MRPRFPIRPLGFSCLLFACSGDDGKPARDSGPGSDASADAGSDAGICPADAGGDADTDGDEDLCACLRRTEVHECMPAPNVSCDAPEDCCDDESPVPCGYFGNRFVCAGGFCEPEGCTSHAECRTWAEATGLPDPNTYGCLEPPCDVGSPYCGPGASECDSPEDCCFRESPIPCGDYGNRWNCFSNRCSVVACECDAECVEYATRLGLDGAEGFVCARDQCGDYQACVPGRPCAEPSDCCDGDSPIPCGTFGNRFACYRGQCHVQGCDDGPECVAYANALGAPDAANYECE